VDFGALPPEVNSGLMYAGAGAGPLVAAAGAWDGLSSELGSAAASYQAVVSGLTGGPWLGPSAASMAAAAAPYLAWMNTTAAQAEQTASQARSAAVAYEAAFAATVPPPVIAANRALLASLVATNFLGQNTPAIAATETHYAEMWAQDATAMYDYAGASAVATTLTPFAVPQQNTNPTGLSNQAAAVVQAAGTGGSSRLLSTVPDMLQGLASGGLSDPTQGLISLLQSPLVSSFAKVSQGMAPFLQFGGAWGLASSAGVFLPSTMLPFAKAASVASVAPAAAEGSTLAGWPGSEVGSLGPAALGGAGVSAGLGRSASVGGLSVPQSWGTAPSIRLASTALPLPGAGPVGLPEAGAAGMGGWPGGLPPVGSVVNAPRNGEARSRSGFRPMVVPTMTRDPALHDDKANRVTLERRVRDGDGSLSDSERDELDELRSANAELAMERDLLKRSAALLIKEAMQR
jgi:PPE-repeat protein